MSKELSSFLKTGMTQAILSLSSKTAFRKEILNKYFIVENISSDPKKKMLYVIHHLLFILFLKLVPTSTPSASFCYKRKQKQTDKDEVGTGHSYFKKFSYDMIYNFERCRLS